MNIELAIGIALTAHEDQVDKAGAPYILHSLRVMHKMTAHDDMVVAVLHDVVEDTAWDFQALTDRGLTDTQLLALEALTHRKNEAYGDYIDRIAMNPIAVRVKLADLWDNMNINRIPAPTKQDWARLAKYAVHYKRLKRLAS